jgi:Protein of unknown function (DUF3309)
VKNSDVVAVRHILSRMSDLRKHREKSMLGIVLIVVLILVLIGALPTWPHSRSWGYYPSSGIGLLFVIIIILLLMGRI